MYLYSWSKFEINFIQLRYEKIEIYYKLEKIRICTIKNYTEIKIRLRKD